MYKSFLQKCIWKKSFIGYLTKTKYYNECLFFNILLYFFRECMLKAKVTHNGNIFTSWADNYKQRNTNLESYQ